MRWAHGLVTRFAGTYHAIVADQRLVYAYDLYVGGEHFSTSLADVVFQPQGAGTGMTFVETSAYYGGRDVDDANRSRILGTESHFDSLAEVLAAPPNCVPS